jgi:hypothetical protein
MGAGRPIMSTEDAQDLEQTKKIITKTASGWCLLSRNTTNDNDDEDHYNDDDDDDDDDNNNNTHLLTC